MTYDEFDHAYAYEGGKLRKGLLIGLLVGGLIGAAVMLFVAPDSGKKTLRRLQKKTMKLREHTMDTVEDAMKHARHRANKVTKGVRKQASHLSDRGQHVFDQQRERVADLVQESRKRIRVPGR